MDFVGKEKEILKFWDKIGLLKLLKEKNKQGEPWGFLDGPITANNPMGVHHAWGRTYKDLLERYKAMQGYNCRFQNGFDCQGLWVEVEVEKELGFKTKKDIEGYGIEKFVNKCKERAHKYSTIQTEQSIRLGMLKDWGDWRNAFDEGGEWLKKRNSYYTMSDENNYAIWHFLKKCKEQGLLYKGRDVVPWCPRCGTAISQHEILTEEYKEITHKAVFVKFKVIGGLPPSNLKGGQPPNIYLLVWTTTPWTLPGNVALAVRPDFDYVKVEKDSDVYILLKEKADEILSKDSYEILETIKGKELVGLEYEGIFDELPAVEKTFGDYKHKIVSWKDITQEEGTGIVHIAPGCGQEDYALSREQNLPVIDLTDNESNYRDGFGELSGKFVGREQVREWIFRYLEEENALYKIEDYKHRYPTCWRCKSELIFRLVDEWYISMEKLREPLKQVIEKINWLPGFCKERELDWLNNMQDWLISKKRYWGLALPIFECAKCGNFEVLGSKEELKERAVAGWSEFDGHSPHRPWIDNIKIKCAKCGAVVSRILDVGNPWLDAGIVPFSTMSDNNCSENIPYFSGKRAEWQKWFPVELVCESFPGQFKNWFYVLLVMSYVLEQKPPFKNLLGYASVVDEKGEEMHKSKGNAIWFDEAIEKISADVMRWMYVIQNPAHNMRFGYNVAKETQRKILTLVNCFEFYKTYASEKSEKLDKSEKSGLDAWIISRLNNTIKIATEALDSFDPMKASLAIEDFWTNDLSLWYVRRSRDRFAEAEPVLYQCLLALSKLIAPLMPFLSERIYQNLKTADMPTSVHLCDYPKADKEAIDEKLEQEMQETRGVTSLSLAQRAQLKIPVRQALNKLTVKKHFSFDKELLGLIQEEVNVKEVVFDNKIKEDVVLDTEITKELKQEGLLREIIRNIQGLRKQASLTPKDNKIVFCYFTENQEIEKIIIKNKVDILSKTRCFEIKKLKNQEGQFLQSKNISLQGGDVFLALQKQ